MIPDAGGYGEDGPAGLPGGIFGKSKDIEEDIDEGVEDQLQELSDTETGLSEMEFGET